MLFITLLINYMRYHPLSFTYYKLSPFCVNSPCWWLRLVVATHDARGCVFFMRLAPRNDSESPLSMCNGRWEWESMMRERVLLLCVSKAPHVMWERLLLWAHPFAMILVFFLSSFLHVFLSSFIVSFLVFFPLLSFYSPISFTSRF